MSVFDLTAYDLAHVVTALEIRYRQLLHLADHPDTNEVMQQSYTLQAEQLGELVDKVAMMKVAVAAYEQRATAMLHQRHAVSTMPRAYDEEIF